MGISWHSDDYRNLSRDLEEYIREELMPHEAEADVHATLGKIISILIDNGAVDPT